MKTDPGIEPTREARRAISRELDHDAVKLVQHYVDLQKRFSDRLRHSGKEEPVPAEQSAEPDVILRFALGAAG